MKKSTKSNLTLGIALIGVFLISALLMFIPAWIIMIVWNYLAVSMGGPELSIWMAWLIVFVIKMLMPASK